MAFTVKVWNGVAAGGAALEAESNAITYRLRRCMNQPSEATVTLNDVNFAMTQKYWLTGASARVGFALEGAIPQAQVQIEDPTGTTVFDGVCMAVRPNPTSGTVELQCRDWLEQFAHQEIVYETRADLDGAGLRESTPMKTTEATFYNGENPIFQVVGDSWFVDQVGGGAWAVDQWNGAAGTYYCTFSEKMAGAGSVWHGADHKANGIGNLTNDFDHTWLDAGEGEYMQYTDGVGGLNIGCELHFKCWIPEANVDRMELEYRVSATVAGAGQPLQIQAYDFTNTTWRTLYSKDFGIYPVANPYQEEHRTLNFNRWAHLGVVIGDYISGGEIQVRIHLVGADLGDTLTTYFARLTTYYKDVAGYTGKCIVADTMAAGLLWLAGVDLPTAGMDKHGAYSLTKAIYTYVQNLCGTYDTTKAVDTTTDLVTSTNTIARHYPNMTPLAVLQDLARADGTDFWLDKALHLHWNDTYALAGAPTITDADVVEWTAVGLSLDEMANSVRADGMTFSTGQVTHTETNAASITNYGTFTKIVNEPALYNAYDAEDYATNLLNKLKDPMLRVAFIVNGLTAYEQGKVLTLNSANLNVNAAYVVTDVEYDSRIGISRITCTPRQTILFPVAQLQDVGTGIRQNIQHSIRHVAYQPLHTETWT